METTFLKSHLEVDGFDQKDRNTYLKLFPEELHRLTHS